MVGFTEPFDVASPAGGSPISGGDDAIRQLKRALEERFSTIIVDINANPWVLKSAAAQNAGPTKSTGLKQNIPAIAGIMDYLASTGDTTTVRGWTSTGGEVHAVQGENLYWQIPLLVPVGATIKNYRALVQRATSAIGCGMTFNDQSVAGGTSEYAPFNATATGVYDWIDSGAVSILVEAGHAYFIKVWILGSTASTVANPGLIAQVEVTYDLA